MKRRRGAHRRLQARDDRARDSSRPKQVSALCGQLTGTHRELGLAGTSAPAYRVIQVYSHHEATPVALDPLPQ